MQRDEILALLKTYSPPGFLDGNQFLLPPDAALTMVDGLERLGVTLLGVGCWFADDSPDGIVIGEDFAVYFSVTMEMLQSEDRVQKCADAVREFLRNGLLEDHKYVELTLKIPYEDKKFLLDHLKQDNVPK